MKTAEQIAEILFAHTTNNLATYAGVIREAQLEAMKEGMRMAASRVNMLRESMTFSQCGNDAELHNMVSGELDMKHRAAFDIIKASEQLTIKDLP